MASALKYLSQKYLSQEYLDRVTEEFFVWQMRRAAVRINARQHFFPHH
jgi:hypothetical protein